MFLRGQLALHQLAKLFDGHVHDESYVTEAEAGDFGDLLVRAVVDKFEPDDFLLLGFEVLHQLPDARLQLICVSALCRVQVTGWGEPEGIFIAKIQPLVFAQDVHGAISAQSVKPSFEVFPHLVRFGEVEFEQRVLHHFTRAFHITMEDACSVSDESAFIQIQGAPDEEGGFIWIRLNGHGFTLQAFERAWKSFIRLLQRRSSEKLTCAPSGLDQHGILMKTSLHFLIALTAAYAFTPGLTAQDLETWVLTDGRMFEAQVKQVVPGTVTFTLRTGADQPLEISRLSERSKKQLGEALGLGQAIVTPAAPVASAPTAPAATPTPAMAPAGSSTSPAPAAAGSMASVPRDAGAIDATDAGSLEANFGITATVIGKVKRVATLGAAGHKLLEFEDTTFNAFINKRQFEQSQDWHLDGLEGKLVQVKGKVGKYNDKLQIQLFEPSQLGVVE